MITIGLISDTHFNRLLFALPDRLPAIWSDVDLILHAGDVGDPRILNALGRLAPVVAVHGNDEPEETSRLLPETQVVVVRDHRILLWHSHDPDPIEEKAFRADRYPWSGRLSRIARHGSDAAAQVVVYGHTHIPMISRIGDIVLINPGAPTSGSFFRRQRVPSVAKLSFSEDGAIETKHFDLRTGKEREFPEANPEDEFSILRNAYQESLAAPDLLPFIEPLRKIEYKDLPSVFKVLIPEYRRVIQAGFLHRENLIAAFRSAMDIDPGDRQKVLAVLEGEIQSA